MQKILFLLLLLAVSIVVQAQDDPPCATFNEGSMGNWELIHCIRNPGGPFTNPFDLSPSASIRDNHTASLFENKIDYTKLGTRFPGKCLVFDYNVKNDGLAGRRGIIHPTIYVSDKHGRTVYFTAYATLAEGSGWAHVRAPIGHFDYARMALPSNNDGYWTSPYMPGVFDEIIDSSEKITFSIDLLGSSATTEEINIDNVCVVDCNDSNSKGCYADFKLTYSHTTLKSHSRNRMGKIDLFEYHKSSAYTVDWGDGFSSESFEPHIYAPGVYNVTVSERTQSGGQCKASIPVCIKEDAKSIFGPTADTSCNANFMIEISTSSNLSATPKHTADISMLSESPVTFVYNWGDKTPTSGSPLAHKYREGDFLVCATGVKADGTECKECMDICISAKPDTIPTYVIEETVSAFDLRVVPNPAATETRIVWGKDLADNAHLSVYDMMGKVVFSSSLPQQQKDLLIDLSSFNSGLYFVRLSDGFDTYLEKISVVR